jgi:uncharacterized protein YdaU (DUF1376 family)
LNYYERHLGDYARDAGHLTVLEHGVYTLLLDRYYVTEQGIPADQAQRIARARSKEEIAAVDAVLKEFFRLVDGVWINGRCEEEIVAAHVRIETSRTNGKGGGRPKKQKPTGNPSGIPPETQQVSSGFDPGNPERTRSKGLQSPITNHQSPDTKEDLITAHASTAVDTRAPAPTAVFKPTPEGEMALALRDRGVTVSSMHPTLVSWVNDGFTTQQAIDATELARMRKPYPEPIPPAYLDRILRQPQRPQVNGHKPAPEEDWFKGTDHWKSMSQDERDEFERSKAHAASN